MSNGSSAGSFIPLAQAVEMTTRYRQNKEQVINPVYTNQDILAVCDKFDKSIFETLILKANCTAIRIYYGMDETLKIHPIVVAVNENDEDILPGSGLSSTLGADDTGEDSLRCPPYCPPPSPLNS